MRIAIFPQTVTWATTAGLSLDQIPARMREGIG